MPCKTLHSMDFTAALIFLLMMGQLKADPTDYYGKLGSVSQKGVDRQDSTFAGFSKDIIFNTNEPTNDLEGSLEGEVSFAQNVIIPSKNATDPDDYRPHLISLRDTLILFKPITNISFDSGLKVSVSNENGKELFSGNMSPPEDLPKVPEQITDDIPCLAWKFIEPYEYDEIIDNQEKIDQLGDAPDKEGYLKAVLETKRTKTDKQNERKRFIMIRTSDGNWKKNFYLPPIDESHESILIVFDVQSTWGLNVNFNDKKVFVKGGTKNAFTNINGVWDTIYNSSTNQISGVRELISEKVYKTLVENQYNFNEIKEEENMKATINEYLEAGNVHIKNQYNNEWIEDLWLPLNNESNEGKFVTFSSESNKDSRVHYGPFCNYTNELYIRKLCNSLPLQRSEKLVFLYNNGKWVEYSNILFSKIKYGDGLWSMKIPKDAIVPNVQISFSNSALNGVLNNIEIGAPTEILLHTIVIGMLVPAEGEFANWDSKYHTEYFQRVPVSRLIVTEYEPVTLEKVVLPDGTIYTNASTDIGGMYDGDMRERIGKELISRGINLANYGIHSTGGLSKTHPYTVAQITAHNQIGNYQNGVIRHGLSGGAGMVTLVGALGNELSHELSHNYEVGHYPNGFKGSVHRSSEFFGSTWGWDSVKNIFLPNFDKAISGQYCPHCSALTCLDEECQKAFYGHRFLKDPMAAPGWTPYPSVNSYSFHTPYTLMRIQQFLEGKAVFDPTSSTGMRIWNNDCECMKEWEIPSLEWVPQIEVKDKLLDKMNFKEKSVEFMKVLLSQYCKIRIVHHNLMTRETYIPPASPAYVGKIIHIQNHDWNREGFVYLGVETGADKQELKNKKITIRIGEELIFVGKEEIWEKIDNLPPGELDVDVDDVPRTPAMQRIPVATFVGYYDPLDLLESYIYPALHGSYGNTFADDSEDAIRNTSCIATIKNEKEEALEYELKGYRSTLETMNKFHINVAESFEPTVFIIKCNGKILATRKITGPTKDLSFTVNGRPL